MISLNCSLVCICGSLRRWCNVPYDGVTWESEDMVGDVIPQEAVDRFERSLTFPTSQQKSVGSAYSQDNTRPTWKRDNWYTEANPAPEFVGGRKLRSYQLDGINWLNPQFAVSQGSILADEMGQYHCNTQRLGMMAIAWDLG